MVGATRVRSCRIGIVRLPMSLFSEKFRLETLRSYKGPGLFLGGGFLAGLLLFLVWLALRPSSGQPLLSSQSAATTNAAQNPLTSDAGVLVDITGGPQVGQRSVTVEQGGDTGLPVAEEGLDNAAIAEPVDGSEFDTPQVISDEQTLANGLLDAPSQAHTDAPPAPELQTYFVEVMRGPDVSELLEVKAESVEQARSIIRDYHGNPRIVRGPSVRPLY